MNNFLVLSILGIILLSGCTTQPTTTTISSSSSSSSSSATSSSITTTTSSATTTPSSLSASVLIQNFVFMPKSLTVKVGTTVTWTNQDSTTHTVTSDSGSELSSGGIAPTHTYSHTFAQTGTFNYHCSIHPSMTATVVVTQ